MRSLRSASYRSALVRIAAVLALCAPAVGYSLLSAGVVGNRNFPELPARQGLNRETGGSANQRDFPVMGQTARFGNFANDRQGYGVAAYDNHLAYVVNQGAVGRVEDGAVALETFHGSYEPGSTDIAAWTGNLDADGGPPAGTILLKPPSGSGASGFGYGVAINKDYVVVGAKWSQQVFIYDYSGALVRVIGKPVDGARYQISNFAESIGLDGNVLLIGAPNATVDNNEDAGMAFVVDLSDASSVPQPVLAPVNDSSIRAGALAGQTVALTAQHFAIGAPGYISTVEDKAYTTGLVQLFAADGSFERNMNVDMEKGSYPDSNRSGFAGLGRSLVFSSDGTTLYAGDPSCDAAEHWTQQVGRVMIFNVSNGARGPDITVNDGTYIGGALAIGKADAGNDTLYVSYQSADGSAGYVAGYAVTSEGAAYRETLSPFGSPDPRFGSLGLLGGNIVAYSCTSEAISRGASRDATHQRLLVTGQNYVYHLEEQLPLQLEKVSDPASGKRVFPGQKITYHLKIKNLNPRTSPVTTSVNDDLSGVLDFAENGRISDLAVSPSESSVPTFDAAGKKLHWSGGVPGNGSIELNYAVTVKKSQDVAHYDSVIKNSFSSDRSDDNPVTEHTLGKVDVTKTILDEKNNVLPTNAVLARDQDYFYRITISNRTDTDAPITTVVDDMSAVIDDADVNDSGIVVEPAVAGVPTYDSISRKLTWSGAVASGEDIKILIPVHTHDGTNTSGDNRMNNGLTNDRGPDADTLSNNISDMTLTKDATNAEGATIFEIARHKLIRYTVTYTNETNTTVYNASIVDDLSRVLPGAKDLTAMNAVSSDSAHVVAQPTFDNPHLLWSDTSGIKPGETITITYEMKIMSDGGRGEPLVNVVSSAQSKDKQEKTISVSSPVSQLPMSGGPLIAMASLLVVGILLIAAALLIKRYRQNV